MSNEILVNASPVEVRVAVVENGRLLDLFIERTTGKGIVGNIYRGKVVRVLPGMQAAFIDIGTEKAGFLHIKDVLNCYQDNDKNIQDILKVGDMINVQVLKDPIQNKGARLGMNLSIPSRYLVYLPASSETGVSQKIENDTERERLKDLVNELRMQESALTGGFIIRTVAEGIDRQSLEMDIAYLIKLWQIIINKEQSQNYPSVIYTDLTLSMRVLRDFSHDHIDRIRVDSKLTLQNMIQFTEQFCPNVEQKMHYYLDSVPIFEIYNIEEQIGDALNRRVNLKSGGYLIFDQTEAMTTIDVNTGAFVGFKSHHETIFRTNLEAVESLARQIRLRNLGGIIIIDFIDMIESAHQEWIVASLTEALSKDISKTYVSGITELGLVQVVRKRTRESLVQLISTVCSACEGSGVIKSLQTVCYEVFRAVLKAKKAYNYNAYLVIASPRLIDYLVEEESINFAELQSFIDSPIELKSDSSYSQTHFEVMPL